MLDPGKSPAIEKEFKAEIAVVTLSYGSVGSGKPCKFPIEKKSSFIMEYLEVMQFNLDDL